MNDDRIVRSRQLGLGDDLDSGYAPVVDCAPSILVQTTTVSAYPTVAGAYYACHPVEVDGTPVEGGAASYAADTSSPLYAANLGSAIPPAGTRMIAHQVGGRWVFAWDEPTP